MDRLIRRAARVCLVGLLVPLLVAGTSVAGEPTPEASGPRRLVIATGNETGVYFPVGGAICRFINQATSDNGLRCAVESTDGSAENLQLLREGAVDLAIVQSDWHYHAWRGSSFYSARGEFKDLRSLLALHPESFTVVVRGDSKIRHWSDIRGHRVNLGLRGSGQRGTMEVLMTAEGWRREDFASVSELRADKQARALCRGEIDVMLFMVGHPSGTIREATTLCETRLVPVESPAIDRLLLSQPYYRRSSIPGGLYPGNPDAVSTFGVGATLVARTQLPDEVAQEVVRRVIEQLPQLHKLHPALAVVQAEDLPRAGLSAPLHNGAREAFLHYSLISQAGGP